MKNLLKRRVLKYVILAKEVELQLSTGASTKKLFKKVYKSLDRQIKNTILDIRLYVPRNEKGFKLGLINGVRKEHELFVNCFKLFESEVKG